jgi:hypothetical protein
MTTIFCSQKLEKFLGKIVMPSKDTTEPHLGNWNGQSVHVGGKRCMIFLNSKTCYVVLVTAILKKDVEPFPEFFRERLVRQFMDDFQLTEKMEVLLRRELSDIRVCPTNNNRNVIGMMNQHVPVLPYYLRWGPVEQWDELKMSYILNGVPSKADVWARKRKYELFNTREAMGELLQSAMSNKQ